MLLIRRLACIASHPSSHGDSSLCCHHWDGAELHLLQVQRLLTGHTTPLLLLLALLVCSFQQPHDLWHYSATVVVIGARPASNGLL